jgi:hypothetical protein
MKYCLILKGAARFDFKTRDAAVCRAKKKMKEILVKCEKVTGYASNAEP